MKRIVLLICGCWIIISSFSQIPSLAIATDKTTSLIFPFPISHIDRGTKDVLVQQVKEAKNILLVKAASQKIVETNLSVITEDGSVYTFRINYESNPSTWVWHVPVQQEASLATYANGILDNPRTVHGICDNKGDMHSKVIGLYIRGNVMYYQLRLENNSPIDYDIDLLRFYIRDKRKGKRTATQEDNLTSLYVAGNDLKIKATSRNVIVVAMEKWTIPDAKYLGIQIMEKNGGRHLQMKVNNRKIIKAVSLPDIQ